MVVSRWRWVTLGTLLLSTGAFGPGPLARAQDPLPLEGPAKEDSTPPPPPKPASELVKTKEAEAAQETPAANGSVHEALRENQARADQRRYAKAPPAPNAERPGVDKPDPRAIWVPGYWAWDVDRDDFSWVGGTWSIPPRGTIWVGGRWLRDADGWYRTPGFWSRRKVADLRPAVAVAATVPADPALERDWRRLGPPADRPEDDLGVAPSPDSFLVNGHYTPAGDRLVWTPGFWAKARPGWDWSPARWVRRADGWAFRKGHWVRDPEAVNHQVARPANSDLPPAIVDSEPARTNADEPTPADVEAERRASLPRNESDRDLIGEEEAALRDGDPNAAPSQGTAPVVVTPVVPYRPGAPVVYGYSGRPYRMIRPPGSIYGPNGVVVPDAVPPFVQGILDRVLP
ncbi:hypothetical protein [Singulisphaera sp. PoT]|uniref:hypothetical protein n=1 Tax=Singulisphaera sp. PoT TaxID=3411797 RepID=UPI003BF5B645